MLEIYAGLTTLMLTLVSVFGILKLRKKKRRLKELSFRQSSLHSVLAEFLPSNSELRKKEVTQSKLHNSKSTTKVIYTPDNKAYFVKDNVFYCVDVVDGEIDPQDAVPINTDNLSKKDIEKLLFILDTLKNG